MSLGTLGKENFLNDLHFRATKYRFFIKTEQKSIKKEEIRKKKIFVAYVGIRTHNLWVMAKKRYQCANLHSYIKYVKKWGI